MSYLRDPAEIYRQSFARISEEAALSNVPETLRPVVLRMIHACGMTDIISDLAWSADFTVTAEAALDAGAPIFCDARMVSAGLMARHFPRNRIECLIDDPRTPSLARDLRTTRSAAAVELWKPALTNAVVVIGNAPTALFHLLDLISREGVRPAAILGFPVGFVGAAESKEALIAHPAAVPYLTLRGRRGGSAIAAAAANALKIGVRDQS